MKNKKGFTLVELLGVIVILSIIMVIAVPNVMSTLENSKRQKYVTDAKELIIQTKYLLRTSTSVEKPSSNELLKLTLADIGTSDVEKDPDGDSYSLDKSFVVVARKNGYLVYYVNLVSDKGEENYKGIYLTDEERLGKDEKSKLVKNNVDIPTDNQIKQAICSSCTIKKP